MILGGNNCKSPPKSLLSNAITAQEVYNDDLSMELEERMKSFAFVGVTGEWEKSMCLWDHTFPSHKNGRGVYLSGDDFVNNTMFRQTPLNDCKEGLKQLISSNEQLMAKISEDPDWSVFNRAVELMEERLPPQCQPTKKY